MLAMDHDVPELDIGQRTNVGVVDGEDPVADEEPTSGGAPGCNVTDKVSLRRFVTCQIHGHLQWTQRQHHRTHLHCFFWLALLHCLELPLALVWLCFRACSGFRLCLLSLLSLLSALCSLLALSALVSALVFGLCACGLVPR